MERGERVKDLDFIDKSIYVVLYIGDDNIALFVRRVMYILHLSRLFAGVRSIRKQTINLVCGGNGGWNFCSDRQHHFLWGVSRGIWNA
jgi:hypothetical protein